MNQINVDNNSSYPFLTVGNMQMQQKQMPVWSGTCKWPLNGSAVELMFAVTAIPRRAGNVAD
jgi:hypothetical protein